MAKVKITGHASGTGVVTVTAPNTSTDRTITLPDSTDTLIGTATSDALTTRINGAGGRKNLIINGDFQVSQRGDYTSATAATNTTYYLDRWDISTGITATIQDFGGEVEVAATATGSSRLRILQRIEDMSYLAGKTVTISCDMKSNSSVAAIAVYADSWQTINTQHTGGGAWESLSVTLTLPSSISTELGIHFGLYNDGSNVAITNGDYVRIRDVQLELGSVATDFEHRSYGEELALCQRYYYNITGSDSSIMNGNWLAASSFYGHVNFPVSMRHGPSIALAVTTGTDYYKIHYNNAVLTFDGTQFNFYRKHRNGATIYVDGFSAGSQGTGGWLMLSNSSATLAFSCEL